MSSVLHPVGPEPEERYWVRRLAVLGAAVVALILVVALVASANGAGSAVQAAPAPPPLPAPVPATAAESTSAAPTPSGATPSATPTVLPSSPSPAASVGPWPLTSTGPSPLTSTSSSPSATPGSSTKQAAEEQAGKKSAVKKQVKKQAQKPAPLPACPTSTLRSTLTGKRSLKTKQRTTFALSLINGSAHTCYLKVTGGNLALTIYSGRDRIWSSKDCRTAVPSLSRRLAREQAVSWSMRWNGRRSADDCKNRPEIPRPGTYWARAQFDDAKPVRLRMVLHR